MIQEELKGRVIPKAYEVSSVSGGSAAVRRRQSAGVLLKESTLDERIVCFMALSVVFGVYAAGAGIVCVGIYALASPRVHHMLARGSAYRVLMLMLPTLLIPVVVNYARFIRSGRNTLASMTLEYSLLRGVFFWVCLAALLYLVSVMTKRLFGRICDILLLVSIISSIFGLIERFTGAAERVTIMYSNPNLYGYCIELFALIAVYRFMETRRIVYIGLAVMNIVSITLCDCRTAWAAVFAAIAVLLLYRKHSVKYLALLALLAVLFVVTVQLVPQISPRLYPSELVRALNSRVSMWRSAVGWMGENPLLGYGSFGYYLLSYANNTRRLLHAHNIVLNLLLDYGIIGVSLIVTFFARLLGGVRRARGGRSEIGALLVSSMVATLVHGITDVPIYGTSAILVFILVMSGSADFSDDEKSEPSFPLIRSLLSREQA